MEPFKHYWVAYIIDDVHLILYNGKTYLFELPLLIMIRLTTRVV